MIHILTRRVQVTGRIQWGRAFMNAAHPDSRGVVVRYNATRQDAKKLKVQGRHKLIYRQLTPDAVTGSDEPLCRQFPRPQRYRYAMQKAERYSRFLPWATRARFGLF